MLSPRKVPWPRRPIAPLAAGLATLCTGCLYHAPPEVGFPSPYAGYGSPQDGQEQEAEKREAPAESGPGFFHVLLLYLPNRVFDVLDLVRMRVRVGPGISASARATKPASVFVGAHTAVWAGLPGPRGGRTIPLPAGLEAQEGAQVSVADGSAGVYYGSTEVGLGAELFVLGFDVGVDPVIELFDLLGGFLTFDPAEDDL